MIRYFFIKPKENFISLKRTKKYLSQRLRRVRVEIFKHKILNLKKYIFTNSKVIIIVLVLFFLLFPRQFGIRLIHISEEQIKKVNIFKGKTTTDLDRFLDKLAHLESGGSYTIKNQYNYLGKYQIGRIALKEINLGGVPDSIFLNTPDLQEVAIRLLLKRNKQILYKYIKTYNGKNICNIPIDESSILASALMSPAGIIQFLKTNGDSVFCDGNNIQITKYLKAFYGYKLNL